VNRRELRQKALRMLDDSPVTPTFWGIDELNALLTEGQEFLSETLRGLRRTVEIPLRAGTMLYTTQGFSPACMVPVRLWIPATNERLVFSSLARLDMHRQRWMELTTSRNPYLWFLVSWNTLGVWPPAAEGKGTMRVDYIPWPDPLFDDTDEPEFQEVTQEVLVDYMVTLGHLKAWEPDMAAGALQRLLGKERQVGPQNNSQAVQPFRPTRGTSRGVYRS